jgi:hypothetical protein
MPADETRASEQPPNAGELGDGGDGGAGGSGAAPQPPAAGTQRSFATAAGPSGQTSAGKDAPEVVQARGIVSAVEEGKETPELVVPAGTVSSMQRARLEPLQSVAAWLTGGVALLLGAVVIVSAWDWMSNTPQSATVAPPTIQVPESTPGAAATSIAYYKDLSTAVNGDFKARSDTYAESKGRLLDSTAQKLIVPILTLLLGYLFGARLTGSRSNEGGSR